MPDGPAAERRRRSALLLGAIVAVALALRWWGNRFGLPATYHPDEHQYVDAAVAALGGDLNPGRFNNPTLLKYALALAYALWYALGRAAGAWPDVAGWQAAVAADPTTAHVIARGLVGLAGAATCLVVAAIGRRLRDRTTGVLAAAFLAVAFIHARDSHYAVNDVPAALLTTLAVAIALRLRAGTTDRGRARDLVCGAAVVGLATATKYTALVAVLPLGIAWLAAGDGVARGTADGAGDMTSEGRDGPAARRPGLDARRIARRLVAPPVALAALALVAAFLAAVPYAVLDWPAFRTDVALLATRGREGFKGLQIDPAPGWVFYLKSLAWGLGWPLLGAAIVGIGLALRRRRADDWIVIGLPLVLWGYLGSQLNMFARFMLPAVPLLCVLAADVVVGAGEIGGRWSRRWMAGPGADGQGGARGARGGDRGGTGGDRATRAHRSYAWGIAATVGVAVGAPSLVAAVRHDVLLGRTDTRALARAWIAAHVPAGATIVLQSGGPELDGLGYDVESVGTTELPERPLDAWVDAVAAGGEAWLVTSSFSAERRLLDPERDAAARAWYAELAFRYEPDVWFQPCTACAAPPPFVFDQVYGPCVELWRYERPGPFIQIYRLAR